MAGAMFPPVPVQADGRDRGSSQTGQAQHQHSKPDRELRGPAGQDDDADHGHLSTLPCCGSGPPRCGHGVGSSRGDNADGSGCAPSGLPQNVAERGGPERPGRVSGHGCD